MNNSGTKSSKQNILDAAVMLFAQKGYDAVSIREICKAANCNICMISYYWGGKQELYNDILAGFLNTGKEYIQKFVDLSVNPATLSKKEQINLLELILEKGVDFCYANISSDLIMILFREQQKQSIVAPEFVNYLRKIVACVMGKSDKDREVILKTVFLISQINSPKILPAFSLKLLGQDEFTQEDINIIKENVKLYVRLVLAEDSGNV